ncbi:MAG: hypothetical protein MMC23_001169 [Stictis urceolatum]|nr:hypothetical protein [Stictis urceolata]
MSALISLSSRLLDQLSSPEDSDSVRGCGPEALELLRKEPHRALALADKKLRVWPFKDVELRWRRLFEDASLLLAGRSILDGLDSSSDEGANKEQPDTSNHSDGSEAIPSASGAILGKRKGIETMQYDFSWLQKTVRLLDMAIIMTGAPQYHAKITELFSLLESYISLADSEEHQTDAPPAKRLQAEVTGTSKGFSPDLASDSLSIRMPQTQHHPGFRLNAIAGKPYVLKGAIDHWPALAEPDRRWANPSYLIRKTLGGRRLVPVELGRSYTDEGWGQKIMSFGEFMDKWILPKRSNQPESSGTDGSQEENLAYLAQHDLLSQVPALRHDIGVPDAVWELMGTESYPGTLSAPGVAPRKARMAEPIINTWFGPPGTITPLHTDPYDNILCQVVGKKYIRLYPPEETPRMFPQGKELQEVQGADGLMEIKEIDMSNTSSIPADAVEMGPVAILEEVDEGDESPSASKWEDFEQAEYLDLVLEEGQALYIPRGWWHYVRSLTVSFSVSFWWD